MKVKKEVQEEKENLNFWREETYQYFKRQIN